MRLFAKGARIMTLETAAPVVALLQAQPEVMRQYHGDLRQGTLTRVHMR